ncbi:MAG: DUF2236 domain-containing protein [Chitinophagales bacterium]|nr:DUF2236 domain-containing protein [Chitinophagales bacterium]
MKYFVKESSVVRSIWGNTDTVLFIFAGASAEFALNKAVDWLYFTGRLPADPIGRLFSTVAYAQKIVFSSDDDALKAIDTITFIHRQVEMNRGSQIPPWAYRDVLYMLIHYSIAAYELLFRQLTPAEKEEVFDVFYRVGQRMQLQDLPPNYESWIVSRRQHIQDDLAMSRYTSDLFLQYKKQLGISRYKILIEAQKLVVPEEVYALLKFGQTHWLRPSVPAYKFCRLIHLDGWVRKLLLPESYRSRLLALDKSGQ